MVNQVQYHVGMGTDAGGIRSYCKSKNIVVQAYSPLGDGKSVPSLITGQVVSDIAKAHGKQSGATVALKWLVQSGIPVVTKADNPAYLKEDIDLFDFTLSEDEMTKLNSQTLPKANISFLCLN